MPEYVIDKGPSFSVLKVKLSDGERIVTESGAFVLSKGRVEVKTTTGGIFRGLLRAIAGGESLFLNEIQAVESAEVWIAPPVTGDIAVVPLNGNTLIIQDSSYLAHIGDVKVSVAWRGLSGLLAEGELVWVKAEGDGVVFVNSFGAIDMVELGPGERITIDNGHLVAMDGTIRYEIRKFGGWKTFFLGGEGLVVEAEGPGRIWIQTRNLSAFAGILSRFLPKQS